MKQQELLVLHHFNSYTDTPPKKHLGLFLYTLLASFAILIAMIGHTVNQYINFVGNVKSLRANILQGGKISTQLQDFNKQINAPNFSLFPFTEDVRGVLQELQETVTALQRTSTPNPETEGQGVGFQTEEIARHLNNLDNYNKRIAKKLQLVETMAPKILTENWKPLTIIDTLSTTSKGISHLSQLSQKFLLGSYDSLLVLQNNNEIRTTGGFWGSFGTFKLENANIKNLHIDSIYDLDGQLQKIQTLQPPYPLLQVNDKWLLRDSNWLADTEQSAELISELWSKATNTSPDLIVFITPEAIKKLLVVTGPIALPNDNIIDADNFVESTQIQTSIEYDKIENEPKASLNLLIPAITKKLQEQHFDIISLLQAINNSLQEKDFVVFAKDNRIQNILKELGWTGSITQSPRDSLEIVRNNLGGTKTDLYIEEKDELSSDISKDGKITNTLQIYRKNTLPNNPAMKNSTFLRILIPENSKLLKTEGLSLTNLDSARSEVSKIHPVAQKWEEGMKKDSDNNVLIGKEAGHTFIGGWTQLEGGEETNITIKYELPFKLKSLDRLSLNYISQPGANPKSFIYKIKAGAFKPAYTTIPYISQTESGEISWSIPSNKNTNLGLVLTKRND
jgi:hypothetical protein